jgi:hypothetical protein
MLCAGNKGAKIQKRTGCFFPKDNFVEKATWQDYNVSDNVDGDLPVLLLMVMTLKNVMACRLPFASGLLHRHSIVNFLACFEAGPRASLAGQFKVLAIFVVCGLASATAQLHH